VLVAYWCVLDLLNRTCIYSNIYESGVAMLFLGGNSAPVTLFISYCKLCWKCFQMHMREPVMEPNVIVTGSEKQKVFGLQPY